MAAVIPMNAKTARVTELGRYYLLYTCPSCGAAGLSEQKLRRVEERHFLKLEHMSNPELDRATSKAPPTATERSRAAELMGKRLGEGDYADITEKVRCPRCGKSQPWSGNGKPWPRTALALVTAVLAVATLFYLRATAWSFQPGDKRLIWSLLPIGALLLVDLAYILRRRSRLLALRRGGGESPRYCTAAELRNMEEGPFRDLVKPYLKKEA